MAIRFGILPRWLLALALCGWSVATASAQAPADNAAPAKSSAAAKRAYAEAVAVHNQGVYDLAVAEWEQFLTKYAQDPLALNARHYLGVCNLQLKKYAAAAAAFEAVLKANPKFDLAEETYYDLGLAHIGAGQSGVAGEFDKAAETFRQQIAAFPQGKELGKAWYYLGEALYAAGKKDDAVKAYSTALATGNGGSMRPDILYALGVAQQETGKTAEAGSTFDLFLKENAENPLRAEIILRRGEVYYSAKDFANAATWFASAAAAKNFAAADRALSRQAMSMYEQKKYPEAAALYAGLIEKYPQSEYAKSAKLLAGDAFYRAGNIDEAGKWLAQALAAGASVPETAHLLSRTLIKQKKFEEALKVAEQGQQAAADGPLAATLLIDQGDSLYDLPGKRKDAIARYATVATKFPQSPLAGQAQYLAAFTALGEGDFAAARGYADGFFKSYASDPLAPEVKYVAAEADLQLGKPDQAEKLYDELLAAQPTHAAADQWTVRRAVALSLQKKYADVAKALEPIVAQLKGADLLAEANHLLGSAQFELHQYDPAAKSLTAALTAQPKWRSADDTLLVLAATQRQQNKLPDAMATVRKMLTEFPNSKLLDRAHYRLGEAAYASGDFKTAASEYQQVLEKWPQSSLAPHAQYGLGWSQYNSKDYAAAEATLAKLNEKFPGHALLAKAHYTRAMALEQLKQFDAGAAEIDAFLTSNPTGVEKSDALYVKGLCLVGLQKYGPASEIFRTLLKDDPSYASADRVMYELAWALKSENKSAEAAEAFARLAKEHPSSPLAAESLYRVGESQYANKEYSKAAESYYGAEQKAGGGEIGEKAAHYLAWSYFQQGQYDKAQQGFTYQADKYPQGALAPDALFMAAESLFKQNKFEPASAAYQKALAAPLANKDFVVVALLHAGQSAAQNKKWDDSLKLLAQAAKEFPESPYLPEIQYEQGWAEKNRGNLDAAFKLFDEANAANGGLVGARARFMMGEILFEKKDHKEAARNFFKVTYGYGYPNAPDAVKVLQANSAYEAGRCFEVLKMNEQAKKSYKEVVDKFSTSDKAPLSKSRLEALGQ